MKAELWYSVVVRDRHGKIISRECRRSMSFLKQWNQLVYVQMSLASLSIKDTGGTDRDISAHIDNLKMKAAVADVTHGIRVGTGNTAVVIDDYALEAPIGEGIGAGQLLHWACEVAPSVVAAPSCSFVVSRSMVNNSGDSITAKEAGVYVTMETYSGCALRDVFSSDQVVPNGGAITVNWTLQVTV